MSSDQSSVGSGSPVSQTAMVSDVSFSVRFLSPSHAHATKRSAPKSADTKKDVLRSVLTFVTSSERPDKPLLTFRSGPAPAKRRGRSDRSPTQAADFGGAYRRTINLSTVPIVSQKNKPLVTKLLQFAENSYICVSCCYGFVTRPGRQKAGRASSAPPARLHLFGFTAFRDVQAAPQPASSSRCIFRASRAPRRSSPRVPWIRSARC